MPLPPGWNAAEVAASLAVIPWEGSVWRVHKRKYSPTDPGGSLRVSGRYNRGLDLFPPTEVWPVLYLACDAGGCIGELQRHVTAATLSALNNYLRSELNVSLTEVFDGRDPAACGLTLQDMIDDTDYQPTQELARAAIARGAEALWVPSATLLGHNLIVFAEQLRGSSTLQVVTSQEMRLFVPR